MLSCFVNHLVSEALGSAGFNLFNDLEGSTIVPGAVAEEIEMYLEPNSPFRLNLTQSGFYQILLLSKKEHKSLLKG